MGSINRKRGTRRHRSGRARPVDASRKLAYQILRAVTHDGAFANLALKEGLAHAGDGVDSRFVTSVVATTCRYWGVLDQIIEAAGGRAVTTMQPSVVDVLRLAASQYLLLGIQDHGVVDSSVNLAAHVAGERVTGLVNAISRKIVAASFDVWVERLSGASNESSVPGLALRSAHPEWIVESYRDLLSDEATQALAANNDAPVPTLVVRPGLAEVDELDGEPARYSPFGAYRQGNPAEVAAVVEGRAGVQDEGSQLIAWALSRVPTKGVGEFWLDVCAGPGGKTALLTGLAGQQSRKVIAAEIQEHRCELVAEALRAYPPDWYQIRRADATEMQPEAGRFDRILADVPCSGLGALRRRPEARWRKNQSDLAELTKIQADILTTQLRQVADGGVVAYVTCSPHLAETVHVVNESLSRVGRNIDILDGPGLLPGVPDCAASTDPRFIQLWPHRHGTDAMFAAFIAVFD